MSIKLVVQAGLVLALVTTLSINAGAGELTGYKTLFLSEKFVFLSSDKDTSQKCGLSETKIGNTFKAELKRGGVKITERWENNSGLASISIVAIHLKGSGICVIGTRVSVSALANEIQGRRSDVVVEVYGASGIATYSDAKAGASVTPIVTDYSKQLADQLIADN